MSDTYVQNDGELAELLVLMLQLREDVQRGTKRRLRELRLGVQDEACPSACNLADYLALRAHDLRILQTRLARMGLSSLGRCEAHVLASINQLIQILRRATGQDPETSLPAEPVDFDSGPRILEANTYQLFGETPESRSSRIMVTLPSEAASSPELLARLLAEGMNCARINCAHDDPDAWLAMIRHVRDAEARLGKRCVILMDLAGHKLRTGPLAMRPAPMRLTPLHDPFGELIDPAWLVLENPGTPYGPGDETGIRRCCLESDEQHSRLQCGDRLSFRDARSRKRQLLVTEILADGGRLCMTERSAVFCAETFFMHERRTDQDIWLPIQSLRLNWRHYKPVKIRIFKHDLLRLTQPSIEGRPAVRDKNQQVVEPASIGCTTPEILENLCPGQAIWIDDGRIGGVVESADADGVLVRITHCRPEGERLRADKGLNLPGAQLGLPPLSARDRQDLDFIAAHADLVGFSFVESAQDMRQLMDELLRRSGRHLGIIAKIETRRGLENLPEIIMSTLGRHRLGVMIARGDLAVEIGCERLAEIQEEILWVCEAAHVPVIWATQVLDRLAKTGTVARAEVTDAAMAGRAECVMLNKGAHIVNALRSLDDILTRMQAHQFKKTSRMRALGLAG